MILTEDDAKKKWCPFARGSFVQVNGRPSAVNRDLEGNPSHGARCLGSACMAWRWQGRDNPESHGYCGLAEA